MTAIQGQISKCVVVFSASIWFSVGNLFAQTAAEKLQDKPTNVAQDKQAEPPNAAQIDLLETKYRFETNGDSRKEVHALVKINSELGVRQFARLNFDYNRSFQSVEIPLVHITHANGGTSDILPSAITDSPNPAATNFPAFHDVRVKSIRILGLGPGDLLEYRVITTTTNQAFAPDFWVEHFFDRTGVVTHEIFELDVPRKLADEKISGVSALHSTYMGLPVITVAPANAERKIYCWDVDYGARRGISPPEDPTEPDILFSTLTYWSFLSTSLERLWIGPKVTGVKELNSRGLIPDGKDANEILHAGYEYVSVKLRTVDLPLGATGFRIRSLKEILDSGYATQEEKCGLLALFEEAAGIQPGILLLGASVEVQRQIVRPTVFTHAMVVAQGAEHQLALDPSIEVAPYGVVPPQYRSKLAFRVPAWIGSDYRDNPWNVIVPDELPFPARQSVDIKASLNTAGTLSATVKYRLRGDNELLLRVTFHQTPKEKQQEVAQYLALSDGFRGKVTNVKTSDPYDTERPFEVEYEITQEKFVDWTKKPVRIPALLPLPGLPEAPKKLAAGATIELGPPLEVELSGTLKLPAGTTAQVPTGTSVKRDYATFSSQYSTQQNVLHFSRHLNFISSQLPAERALDLNAFLHAVQNDQALLFELDRPASVPPAQPK